MLTGQPGFTTLQVEAVFRNGSTPTSVRDWSSLVAGMLARSLDIQDVRLGKVALGRVPVPGGGSYSRDKQLVALVDVEDELAQQVLERLQISEQIATDPDSEVEVHGDSPPAGIKMAACAQLPELVVDRTERDYSSRSRGEFRGRAGAGGGGRYGDAGKARFGSGSSGGRPGSEGGSAGSGRGWGGSSVGSRGGGTSGGRSWLR